MIRPVKPLIFWFLVPFVLIGGGVSVFFLITECLHAWDFQYDSSWYQQALISTSRDLIVFGAPAGLLGTVGYGISKLRKRKNSTDRDVS